jgi:hypothetical protein
MSSEVGAGAKGAAVDPGGLALGIPAKVDMSSGGGVCKTLAGAVLAGSRHYVGGVRAGFACFRHWEESR